MKRWIAIWLTAATDGDTGAAQKALFRDDYTVHTLLDPAVHAAAQETYAAYEGENLPFGCAVLDYSGAVAAGSSFAEFRMMLVDLLNYGAATQMFTGYKTDALVNASLTDAQKAWGTAELKEELGNDQVISGTPATALVAWKSAGLVLEDAVTMFARMEINDLTGITVKVTCGSTEREYNLAEELQNEEDGVVSLVSGYTNRYDLFFEELNVYQMREPVYFTAYKDGVAVSKELKYSVQTYAGKNAAVTAKNLGDLVVAMMKYGDSAYAYAKVAG